MKHVLPAALLILAVISATTSCKKERPQQPVAQSSSRTLRFILYTNEDFSGDEHNISFALHIDNGKTAPFDSTVFSTKVKNIPDKAHQLVFERKIPNDGLPVTAGFVYTIQNVGISWHLDTCAANEKLKVIEYPFQ